MAKQTVNALKQWFLTGKFPTQQQFHDWLDSFWHKDDEIPIDKVTNLATILNTKVDGPLPAGLAPEIYEGASLGAFPGTGAAGIIYIAEDTNITYRWDGADYVPIGKNSTVSGGGSVLFFPDYDAASSYGMSTHIGSFVRVAADETNNNDKSMYLVLEDESLEFQYTIQ